MEGQARPLSGQGHHRQMHHTFSNAALAAESPTELRRSFDEISAALLRGSTFSGQQQRQQAELCSRLLGIAGFTSALQQQQQRVSASLSSLSHRAAACAENGDARGATAAVLSFLRDFSVALGAAATVHSQEKHSAPTLGAARAALSVIADYCRATTIANAAELRVQRQIVSFVTALFRLSPQLGASGSASLREALAIAATVTATLHRVLGAAPRYKRDIGLQPHLQQQKQQILAAALAAAQPKQTALLRALLVSVHFLIAEATRAKSAAASGGRAHSIRDEGGIATATAAAGTVGEVSVELLLLLLPLSLSQPSAPSRLALQPRATTAGGGWGLLNELTTDFASTQESEADSNLKGASPQDGTSTAAGHSWHLRSQEGRPRRPSRAVTPQTPRTAAAALTSGAELGASSVRAECLRCIEGLLRLCGRELFPYWSLLLHYGRSRLMRAAPHQWTFVASTAIAGLPHNGSQDGSSSTVGVGGSHTGMHSGREPQALDQWLWQLLRVQEKEQQELPWEFLAISGESAKVRRAALGCLCALLEAPPLRQWPETATACGRCGPKALLVAEDVWERLVEPLGFRDPLAARGWATRGTPHSQCCSTLPARQQQHLGSSGAYTSLSRTVGQASRCAILALFSVIRSQLLGQRPLPLESSAGSEAARAPSGIPTATPVAAVTAATGSTADAPSQPRSPLSRCGEQGSPPSTEREATGNLAATALRGLADALPDLPLGILQPGMSAAALRIVHPIVVLLVETLKKLQQRQEQVLQGLGQEKETPVCCLCRNEETPDAMGHEWSALNPPAAAVARGIQADSLPYRPAAAPAARMSREPLDSLLVEAFKGLPSVNTPHTGIRGKVGHKGRGERTGAFGGFEAFGLRVLARGPSALRLGGPGLALLTAVIGGRQRQPEVAEALIAPFSSTATVCGPSCLAAQICQAVESLASLGCHQEDFISYTTAQQAATSRGVPPMDIIGQATKASCQDFAVAIASGPGGRRGDRRGSLQCNSCERHGSGLLDGLFAVLQAIAKRYPQVLLLLASDSLMVVPGGAADASSKTAVTQIQPLSGPRRGPFLEMLRSLFHCPTASIRIRAAALAVEVLGASNSPQKSRRHDIPRGNPEAMEGSVSPRELVLGSTPDVVFAAPRESLINLLLTALLVPLLSRRLPSAGGETELRSFQVPSATCKAAVQAEGGHGLSVWSPTLAFGDSLPPDQLSTACGFLCRLTYEEWQRHDLAKRLTLEALSSLTAPQSHRSVRLAAAAALGTFAVRAVQMEQAGAAVASGAIANVPRTEPSPSSATESVLRPDSQAVREAVGCLLLQLADPLPDVRAAALSAICETAGELHQQLQPESQPPCIGSSICDVWEEVLKAINDVLDAGDKSVVTTIALRAVGAVVPLVLQSELHGGRLLYGLERPIPVSVTVRGGKGESGASKTTSKNGTEEMGAADSCWWSPKGEITRSLTLLECALRPKQEGGEADDGNVETPCDTTDLKMGGSRREEHIEGGDMSRPEPAAGLRQLKLHWNACNSTRLIFSSPAATLLLAQGCSSVLSPLWLATCGCLQTSQLAKVRSHAAAALAAMVELVGSAPSMNGIHPREMPQATCANCMAPLLTEAWRAVAASAKKADPLVSSEECNERPGSRAVLRRYTESLRQSLKRLLAGDLLICTQKCLKIEEIDHALFSPDTWPQFTACETRHAEPLSPHSARESAWVPRCVGCLVGERSFPSAATFEALREAMERALQAGSSILS